MSTLTLPSSETIRRNDSDKKGGRTYTLPDGTVVPSVTSILSVVGKPALVNWAAKTEREMVLEAAADLNDDLPEKAPKMSRMGYLATLEKRIGATKAHTKQLAKAGEIGTQIHNLIEWNLRKELGQAVGPEPQVKDKALWGFMVYEEWRKKVAFRPIKIEQQVWSRRHRYAGTMDWLAWMSPYPDSPNLQVLTVGDWKSGKAIYDEYYMQVAAYVMAIIEMGHAKPPVDACIVRLPKVETDPEPEMAVIPWEQIPYLFQSFLAVRDLFEYVQGRSRKVAIPVIPYDPIMHLGVEVIEVDPAVPGEDRSVVAPIMAAQAEPSQNGAVLPDQVPTQHASFEQEPVEEDPFAPKRSDGIPPDVSERAEASDPNREGIPISLVDESPIQVSDEPAAITRDEYESWLAGRTEMHRETVQKVAEILHLSSVEYDRNRPELLMAFKLSVEDRIALEERKSKGGRVKTGRRR